MLNFLKSSFVVLILFFSFFSFAETSFMCSLFNSGCLTKEEKEREKQKIIEKETKRCTEFADNSYSEYMENANRNPNTWRYSGKSSAQEYVEWRQRGLMSICMKEV
jgi:hypothetical protein